VAVKFREVQIVAYTERNGDAAFEARVAAAYHWDSLDKQLVR
jgi:hypothetical protein